MYCLWKSSGVRLINLSSAFNEIAVFGGVEIFSSIHAVGLSRVMAQTHIFPLEQTV